MGTGSLRDSVFQKRSGSELSAKEWVALGSVPLKMHKTLGKSLNNHEYNGMNDTLLSLSLPGKQSIGCPSCSERGPDRTQATACLHLLPGTFQDTWAWARPRVEGAASPPAPAPQLPCRPPLHGCWYLPGGACRPESPPLCAPELGTLSTAG